MKVVNLHMCKHKGIVLLSVMLMMVFVAQAQDCLPTKPKGDKVLVLDNANIINAQQEKLLNDKLVEFGWQTSNQIVVITVNDLCGFSPNQFTTKIGDDWGVGQSDEDNGIILLVKPKTKGSGKGEVYIATGRGLEGVLPDILARRIVDYTMIPQFKKGNMVGGINDGVEKIITLAKGEYDEEISLDQGFPTEAGIFLLFFLLVIGVILAASYYRVKNYATLNNIPFWSAYTLLNQQAISRNGMPRHSGGSIIGGGGFSRGGGSSGSRGFGGFGGGSFGGGGAGGSW